MPSLEIMQGLKNPTPYEFSGRMVRARRGNLQKKANVVIQGYCTPGEWLTPVFNIVCPFREAEENAKRAGEKKAEQDRINEQIAAKQRSEEIAAAANSIVGAKTYKANQDGSVGTIDYKPYMIGGAALLAVLVLL